jgi:glutamate-1-semialdehyde 2,1-aminomutase
MIFVLEREKLSHELAAERELHLTRTPQSRALFAAGNHLLGRVPMTWMNKWAGGYPLYLKQARGNRITDVDGNEYIDFSLGDTGAMAGHSPEPTVRAVNQRIGAEGGITTMMPSADAEWVAEELTQRFGLPLWSFSLTATDANRWALRIARQVTGKSKVLAFSYCYHGAVDETLVRTGANGETDFREGNVGPAVHVSETTRVAEFNDLVSVENALKHGDVAVVITEPALTNIGIVLPDPGFLDGLRELCTQYGALLLIDETHTISAGWGGCTKAWNLQPDILVIGKSIGGGIPSGAYGVTQDLADQIFAAKDADLEDVGGVGGTLAGNVLSTAAMRATMGEVLTPAAFDHMIELATAFREGVEKVLAEKHMPWSIAQLGARAEYRFCSPAPKNGTESAASFDADIEEYLHLYMSNRGVLMTPFHNMALMCPATIRSDVDRHTELFGEAVARITQ